MKAFLVDDETLARERLSLLLANCGSEIEITGECGTAATAIDQINELHPDIVFLDIQMPELDGFDVVSLLNEPLPYIVFVTAYDHYAIKAFEVYALDYLTKPVRAGRLKKTLQNLEKRVLREKQPVSLQKAIQERSRETLRVLAVKKGKKIKILDLDEIYTIESSEKLNFVHTEDKKFLVNYTLDELEQRLDPSFFVRVHRSALVNLKFVKELIPWFSGTMELKLKNGRQVSVSRRRVNTLKKRLGMKS